MLGQSLLTPVIGTLTDAFSQRLQFALYPTYVSPEIQDEQSAFLVGCRRSWPW